MSFRGRRAPFCVWVGSSLSVLFVVLLSAPFPAGCCFPSPCGWSLVAPWSSFYAGPSLWVSGCFSDGLVALPLCWGCGRALSSLLHFVSWQQRPLALCGVFYPLHHVAGVVRALSITTLRYSSVMIQVPHWTPLSCTIAILGCNCGMLHPGPLLPSRRPLSLSCLWLCLGLLLCGSFRFFMRPPPPPLRRVTSGT